MEFSFRFCPKCGQPLESKSIHGHDVPVCTSTVCGYIFWQNSKPCSTIVLENKAGEILLCVRAVEPDQGKLDLPGGFLNFGEHPYDGAHREIHEELGVEIAIDSVLGFSVDRYGDAEVATLVISMLAHITKGEPKPADDVEAIRWIKPADIDRNDLAFTNNEDIIFSLYENARAARLQG